VKHVQSQWFNGPSINFAGCHHCELRDSYLHESQMYKNTGSGGGAYLLSLDNGTSNSLIENNAIWNGNKVIVMRMSGGGNVIAYNYMDDAWGSGAAPSQEAGINAGHFVGSHMELFEGNWTFKYSGDSWWGNSIYITAFRNQLSGLRSAHGWLKTFNEGTEYPYSDCWNRTALTMQTYSWWHSIVGNILGYDGQTLRASPFPPCHQDHWRYETYPDGSPDNSAVTMYEIGATQDNAGFAADPDMYQKTNRQGNYDFVTKKQIWYETFGGKGETSTGEPQTLPDSLYLKARPAWWPSGKPWPWVDPSTGTAHVLPAKYCFDEGQVPTCAVQ
jgi:hypothetical protein